MSTISGHQILYKDADCYSTFPWAARIDSQKLILVFRQADRFSRDAARSGRVTHHETGSWVASLLSHDNGKTWDRGSHRVIYRSDSGVNDPAVTRLSDGQLIVRVTEIDVRPTQDRAQLTGPLISHRAEHQRVASVRGNVFFTLDPDSKKTITGGERIEAGEYTRSCSREPITEIEDGTWLLPVYAGAPFGNDAAYLLRSFDQGRRWGDASVMLRHDGAGYSDLDGINFNETSLLSFGDGEMLAMGRADRSFHVDGTYVPVGGVGELHAARSFNWGLSWSRPEKTEIFGQPAHLLRLDGDRVLCTYGHRQKPFGIRAVVSPDRGRTWVTDKTIELRGDGLGWDLGYPMTVRLDETRFLTVYYFTDADGVRFIAGTTWSLE